MPAITPKEHDRLTKKAGQLTQERDSKWLPKWKDQRDNISPSDGQFEGDLPNDGKRKDYRINNPKPLVSAMVLSAGMASGMTNQARPWFELVAPEGVAMNINVKRWLYDVQEAIRSVLSKSNLYNILPKVYHSQGVYGTGVMDALPDDEDVVRFKHHPCGTYALDTNAKGQVDTFYREFTMTPRQMVQQFGKDNLSQGAKLAAENGELTKRVICHMIEPNPDADMKKADNLSMRWRSTYWEKGCNEYQALRRGGFKNFPIMAPRWDVNGVNVYGTGPGDVALGKCRELQMLESDKMRLVQLYARPALSAPVSMRGQMGSAVPGGVTWLPDNLVGQAMQPVYTPDPAALPNLRSEINECEMDIGTAFFEDLFLLITQSDGTMTAYEVAQRKEEKMLMLGPVVERNNDELLDPLIDQVFGILYERSLPFWQGLMQGTPLIPPPPEELQGVPIKVEYISILAQAQKSVAVGSIERALQFTGMLVQTGFNEALDKINVDEAQDAYYDAIGAPPTIMRGADEVAAIREGRARQIAAQQGQEQGLALAQGAKLLSETPTDGDTALSAMISQASGG